MIPCRSSESPAPLFRELANIVFLATGGGNKGCIQAGHIDRVREWIDWRARSETIRLKALVGTSVGAFNLAHWALGMPQETLEEFWRHAKLRDFGKFNWSIVLGMMNRKWRSYLLDNSPMRRYLGAVLPRDWSFKERFLVGVSAYSRSGYEFFGAGIEPSMKPADAVLSSMAIPGVFKQPFWDGTYWGDASCMLNKIPFLEEGDGPASVTIASILGYSGMAPVKVQKKYWAWEWYQEAQAKVFYEEYKREIEGWGQLVSPHVRYCPKRGWLLVLHNVEGRKLAPHDFSGCGKYYDLGRTHAGAVLTEFEIAYRSPAARRFQGMV